MALPPTTNAGTQYFNRNQCRSFALHLTTALTKLSGAVAPGGQPCSEVIIYNGTGALVYIYDRGAMHTAGIPEDEYRFMLSSGETFTFRGLTNVDQVSAKTSSSAGKVYYRTQYYSSNTSTS